MKRFRKSWAGRCQHGVAAVEMALMLPALLGMLGGMLLMGRVCYHYEVALRAAHDAAVYLSQVPQIEMRTAGQADNEVALAKAIVTQEIAGLNPGPDVPAITVQCDGVSCTGFAPGTIRIVVQLNMIDELFDAYTFPLMGDDGIRLVADVTLRYVGK